MLQKAALSFMLATQAPVIILDEPTLGLDVVSVKEVVNMINQLKETQKKHF
jgi:ABC-type multidrug transport system ATPase subunit